MFILFGGYIWLVTSGHDQFVFTQGKKIYQSFVEWFDDAEVDFQVKKGIPKKKSRRWD
jgi:hypothetical protein